MPSDRVKNKRQCHATCNQTSFHVSVTADGYTEEEAAFLVACAKYRADNRRSFLSACDYLRVLKALGWVPPPVPIKTAPPNARPRGT